MEKYELTVEINELINMIKNRSYLDRDFFIKELILNSSESIDKLINNSITEYNNDFKIKIKADKENKILEIEDNGIGIKKEELINGLGSLYKSELNDKIGFYSLFLVADKVNVISKFIESDECYEWESNGNSLYTIKEHNEDIEVGTKIIMHMKDDTKEYLNNDKLEEIIKKDLSNITYPIYIHKLETIEEVEEEEEDKAEIKQNEEILKVEEIESDDIIEEQEEIRDPELTDTKKIEKWIKINDRSLKYINEEDYTKICKKIKDLLGEKIGEVKISQHYNMVSTINSNNLEINPRCSLINRIYNSDNEELNKKLVDLIYECSILSCGYEIEEKNNEKNKEYENLE